MKYELNGKVAIVVGGGGSTGSAACKMLAANGAKVVVAGRTLETLNAVVKEIAAQGGTAIAATADVTSTESMNTLVDAAVKAFGRVDAMVNCAGVRGRRGDRRQRAVSVRARVRVGFRVSHLRAPAAPGALCGHEHRV